MSANLQLTVDSGLVADSFRFVLLRYRRSHYFLKLLEDKGKLLRIYSQVRLGAHGYRVRV